MATKSSPSSTKNASAHHRGGGNENQKKKRPANTTTATTGDKNKGNGTLNTGSYNNSNKKAKYSKSNSSNTKNSRSSSDTTKTSHSKQPVTTLHPRKNADIVERGKRLWNSLRCKTNTTLQIREYMEELFPLLKSKVMELTMQHDASRIVQAAIQFGNLTERQQITHELCSGGGGDSTTNATTTSASTTTATTTASKHTFLDVCQSQYAHFVILKLFKYCSKDPTCLQLLINALKGNVMKLITHSNGSRIVEVLWQGAYNNNSSNNHSSSTAVVIPKDKMALLKQEIYGPHYAVFAQDTLRQLVTLVQEQPPPKNSPKAKEISYVTPTLQLNIALFPDKKDITMDHIRNNIIVKGMDKQLYGYDFFQEILCEYVHVLRMDENFGAIRDLTTTTNLTDQTIHLLSSKYGCQVVHHCVAYSTPKERKRILKSCKGYTKSALFHAHAYLVIIRLLQCMDDTVVLYKNLLQELVTPSVSNTGTAASVSLSNSAAKNTSNQTHLSISKSKDIDLTSSLTTSKDTKVLLDIALSDTASKFLLMILTPTATATTTEDSTTVSPSSKIFNPYEQETLSPLNPYILEKVANDTSSTDHSSSGTTMTKHGVTVQKVYTSKKDPELRRHEILQYFHVPLLQLCCDTDDIGELLRSIPGSNVLYHVYVATTQALVQNSSGHQGNDRDNNMPKKPINSNMYDQLLQLLNDMIRTICTVCRSNLTSADDDDSDIVKDGKENIFEHVVGHRIIKNLILFDASIAVVSNDDQNTSTDDSATTTTTTTNIPSLTELFIQEFESDFMSMIEYNRGAFILVALLQVSSVRTRVLEHLNVTTILQPSPPLELHQEKKPSTSTAGWQALRQEITKTI